MKTIIFDLGNVLINVDFNKMYQQFSPYISQSFEEVMYLLRNEMVAFNKGTLTPIQFYQKVIDTLDLDLSFTDFSDIWVDIFEKNSLIYDFAEQIDREEVRIIIASNTDPLHYEYIKNMYTLAFAGGEFLSYLEQEVKPELSFFQRLIKVFAINTSDAIFIDDLQDNVAAAIESGLSAVHHVNNQTTVNELELFLTS